MKPILTFLFAVLLVCPGPILRPQDPPHSRQQTGEVPDAAMRPAAGARLRGIDPSWLAKKILSACQQRKPELVVPRRVRLLLAVAQLSPRLGDWLLLRATSE